MNLHHKLNTAFKSQIVQVSSLCFIFSIYFGITYILSTRFGHGGYSDLYQYTAAFHSPHRFLDIKLPLIGDFAPFSDGWGMQWPFYMVIKSIIFSITPYNVYTLYLLGAIVMALGIVLTFKIIFTITCNPWIASASALIVATNTHLLGQAIGARPEPLVGIIFIVLLHQIRAIAKSGGKNGMVVCFLCYFLLPGLHPLGLMIAGGLVVIHSLFFKKLFVGGSNLQRYVPILGYAAGLLVLFAWFYTQNAAREQFEINLEVQKIIYETASRFTFFTHFVKNPKLLVGFIFWLPAMMCTIIIMIDTVRFLLFHKRAASKPCDADQVFAAAIIAALPLIGCLFKVDNFTHFSIGILPAIYLMSSFLVSHLSSSSLIVGALLAGSSYIVAVYVAITGFNLYKFAYSGYPDLRAERIEILKKYENSGKVFIHTDFFLEAIETGATKYQFYTFPTPMIDSIRKKYESKAIGLMRTGDIIIYQTANASSGFRMLSMPINSFAPPLDGEWELIGQHKRDLRGKTQQVWDLHVFRRR